MNKMNLAEIKNSQYAALKKIHEFCVKRNLKYSFWGGSLIGAIRHNGYIPWDDDIDICMLRGDYEIFIKEFKDEEFAVFSCDNNNMYPYPWAKVFDKKTKKVEPIFVDKNFEIGIDVDLFPIDSLAGRLSKKEIKERALLCMKRQFSLLPKKNGKSFKTFAKNIIGKCFHGKANEYSKEINYMAQRDSKKEPEQYMLFADANLKTPRLISKNIFDNFVLHKFEDGEFYIVERYDDLLKLCFGDYMQLPPVSQRISHHTFDAYWKNSQS